MPALLFVLLFSDSAGNPRRFCFVLLLPFRVRAKNREFAFLCSAVAAAAASLLPLAATQYEILKKDTGNNFHGQHFTLNKFITFMIEFASRERLLHMYKAVSAIRASLHKRTLAERSYVAWPAAVDTISSSVLLRERLPEPAPFAVSEVRRADECYTKQTGDDDDGDSQG